MNCTRGTAVTDILYILYRLRLAYLYLIGHVESSIRKRNRQKNLSIDKILLGEMQLSMIQLYEMRLEHTLF